jgi:hypothetical protein
MLKSAAPPQKSAGRLRCRDDGFQPPAELDCLDGEEWDAKGALLGAAKYHASREKKPGQNLMDKQSAGA